MIKALRIILIVACALSFLGVFDAKTEARGYLYLLTAISSAVTLIVSYKVL